MSRLPSVSVALWSLVSLSALLVGGCREEPTIVIKFEPADMAGKPPADLARAAAPDLAPAATATASAATGTSGKAGAAGKAGAGGKTGAAECKLDADCAVEPDDCCSCTSGGRQHAVAKKKLAALAATRKQTCQHTMCPMMISHDPTCSEVAACVAGLCALTKK